MTDFEKKLNQRLTMINKKHVKQFFKDAGKRIGKEGMDALNDAVIVLITRSIRNSRHFKTVKRGEVQMAVSKEGAK